jgi:CDP-paratose 2-epimerase
VGTLNVLEYCKRHRAGLIMLSTSRVYSLAPLSTLPMKVQGDAFVPDFAKAAQPGLSPDGVGEDFSTEPPLSLYGAAKRASELVALEYGIAFDLPIFVNRCGVMAGAGQFGKPDQGIFSFWIHSWRQKRPLKYIGFDGAGRQVRDCLHPRDLASLLTLQMRQPKKAGAALNVGGGLANSLSLAQLSQWCASRFGPHPVASDPAPRHYDVPWLVLDAGRATTQWNWRPTVKIDAVLEEIAVYADQHPDWLDLSSDS